MKRYIYSIFIVLGLNLSCTSVETIEEAKEPLNILWLVTEDMGLYLPMYGDSTLSTPNLSRLAAEGITYTHFFSPSGVCAPSRAAIATGLYPTSFGANHMRTHSYTDVTGLPRYEAVPPPEAKMMSQILREQGYYCSNNEKQDYQFWAPVTAWDESSPYAHWRNRKEGQPFFSIFNFTVTHESGLFEPYGFRKRENRHYQSGDRSFPLEKGMARMNEKETQIHLDPQMPFNIPPYLPDTDSIRRDIWKMYNNIAEMDRQVGAILDQLEADGLLDNTLIFFYADHGGPLPRQKRLIYDSGLRAPLIIRFPDLWRKGEQDDQLINFVDLAPTVMSCADIKPPAYLHGQARLGKYQQEQERKYTFAAADRFDAYTDAIRAVRDSQHKYIINYRPNQGYYLPIAFRERIPSMRELLRLKEQGALSPEQALWFREQKPQIELFDCKVDPHELHNLAGDPRYAEKCEELQTVLTRWITEMGDRPEQTERELISRLWQGAVTQPVTAEPKILLKDSTLQILCDTPGATIGYMLLEKNEEPKGAWEIYQEEIPLIPEKKIVIQAHRIGYGSTRKEQML